MTIENPGRVLDWRVIRLVVVVVRIFAKTPGILQLKIAVDEGSGARPPTQLSCRSALNSHLGASSRVTVAYMLYLIGHLLTRGDCGGILR